MKEERREGRQDGRKEQGRRGGEGEKQGGAHLEMNPVLWPRRECVHRTTLGETDLSVLPVMWEWRTGRKTTRREDEVQCSWVLIIPSPKAFELHPHLLSPSWI